MPVSYAPTARTFWLFEGLVSPLGNASSGRLPAATVTTIPSCHAASIAFDSSSLNQEVVDETPYERLMTRMLRPYLCACSRTQSTAAITCVTSAAPVSSPTLTLTMRALGATEWMMPAMCVP